jgi:hypothetical protein
MRTEEPVPGEPVFRIEKRYDHGALRYFGWRRPGVFTDEAGVYRLTGVPAGEAFLVETQKKSIQTTAKAIRRRTRFIRMCSRPIWPGRLCSVRERLAMAWIFIA